MHYKHMKKLTGNYNEVILKKPGIICPVVAYAPTREVIPIIAQRPLDNSADSGLNSLTTLM